MSDQYQEGLSTGTGAQEEQRPAETFSLPKNIRQIGRPGEYHIVYIEDYVYTYLHLFLREKCKGDTLRAAVLAGTICQQDGKIYTFISGAMFCEFSALHMETQEDLLVSLQRHFTDVIPLGWYIGCDGQDSHIQSVVKHYYAQIDAAVPGYLIYEDDSTGEADLFCWEQNAMHRMGGYYIYYEKNPQMQEFLIAEKRALRAEPGVPRMTSDTGEIPVRQNDNLQKNMSEQITKHYAGEEISRLTDKKEKDRPLIKKPQRAVYAACAAVLIVAAATGVSQIGNYQSLKNFQEAVSRLTGSDAQAKKEHASQEQNTDTAADSEKRQTENTDAETAVQQTPAQNKTEDGGDGMDGAVSAESKDASQNIQNDVAASGTEIDANAAAVQAASENVQNQIATDADGTRYYVVQKGDSLMSISRKLYQRTDRVNEIRNMNNMSDTDLIYEGQRLIVP